MYESMYKGRGDSIEAWEQGESTVEAGWGHIEGGNVWIEACRLGTRQRGKGGSLKAVMAWKLRVGMGRVSVCMRVPRVENKPQGQAHSGTPTLSWGRARVCPLGAEAYTGGRECAYQVKGKHSLRRDVNCSDVWGKQEQRAEGVCVERKGKHGALEQGACGVRCGGNT
ncbi:hypothetical protein OF83DRAFT_1087779 [Amylostereum chailletii]|nr:hypothetical protein OF83DRAFT_1087779 [Amylostereum chailletii]